MNNSIKRIATVVALVSNLSLVAQLPFLKNREVVKIENWKFLKGIDNDGQLVKLNDAEWQNVKVPHSFLWMLLTM